MVRATGLRVGTVMHAPHGHQVDKVGSDSWRHRRAGAEAVLLAGSDGAVLFLPAKADAITTATDAHHTPVESADIERIAAVVREHLRAVDIVLAEGFTPLGTHLNKDHLNKDLVIEIRRRAIAAKFDSADPTERASVWLTITDEPSDRADEYGFDELAAVVSRITVARNISARL